MAKSLSTYKPEGTPVEELDVPKVGNVLYDQLGELVIRKLNERFKGVANIEDLTEYQPNQPLSFSNIPRALALNQILLQETNGRIKLQNPFQTIQYWSLVRDPTTYADTNSVSVYPKEGPNEDLRQRVLDIIGKSSIEVPILVANLGVERADNEHGFTFTESDDIQVTQAPFLRKDGRYSFDKKKNTLVPDKQGVQIWTPSDQSGLRRAGRDRGDDLGFRYDDLPVSYSDGRVPFFYNPQGFAKNFATKPRKRK